MLFWWVLLFGSVSFVFAKTITYNFDIGWVQCAPDGHQRPCMGVNGVWPLPTIEANKGDTVVVNVNNSLGNQTTSLHFHGMYQRGSTVYDGGVGVSQCPIYPGDAFTYTFVADPPGISWYHAHDKGQYPDGLRGKMIIHDPEWEENLDLDAQIYLSVSDWYRTQQPELINNYLHPDNKEGDIPSPDSFLFDDSRVAPAVRFEPHKRYLIRLVSFSALACIEYHIGGHRLTIVGADGVHTQPKTVDSLTICAGQRYDILVVGRPRATRSFTWQAKMKTSMMTKNIPSEEHRTLRGNVVYGMLDMALGTHGLLEKGKNGGKHKAPNKGAGLRDKFLSGQIDIPKSTSLLDRPLDCHFDLRRDIRKKKGMLKRAEEGLKSWMEKWGEKLKGMAKGHSGEHGKEDKKTLGKGDAKGPEEDSQNVKGKEPQRPAKGPGKSPEKGHAKGPAIPYMPLDKGATHDHAKGSSKAHPKAHPKAHSKGSPKGSPKGHTKGSPKNPGKGPAKKPGKKPEKGNGKGIHPSNFHEGPKIELDDMTLKPLDDTPLLKPVGQHINLRKNQTYYDGIGTRIGSGNHPWIAPKIPTLYTALSTGEHAHDPATYGPGVDPWVLKHNEVCQIYMENPEEWPHPMHLHGHEFQVVAKDSGSWDEDESKLPAIPMMRDTVVIPAKGYVVIRFKADNPGVWFFHCHVDMHLVAGMASTIIEAPELIQKHQSIPDAGKSVCRHSGHEVTGNCAGGKGSISAKDAEGECNTIHNCEGESWGAQL